jgi:type I restriction enzyme M protein
MIEISLLVHNQGPLPIRDLSITTTPDWGHSELTYLAENSSVAVNLAGTGPKVAGTFTLIVSCSGLTLDGQRVNVSREIALNVFESKIQAIDVEADFGGSPYVCGDPVRPERNDVFFGRDELLDQIRRQIIQSGNVVLLEGNRRSGKSSILWHLEGPKAVPGWMGIYCSLQGAEGSRGGVGVPTVEVFRAIATSIATSLHVLGGDTPLPDGTMLTPGQKLGVTKACRNGINEASAFSDFRDYAEVALEKLAERDLGLLLMLDEFDKLQEGIDSGVTSPQVPENFRFLVQTYPRFSAILTGSRRLKRLREEYWSAVYGIGTRFGVTSLPAEAARRLVTEPVKGRLTYSQEAVERAISLTAGQPYLLQCLCNRIFDMAAQLKARSVTLDLVEQAGDALVEDNEHFASLWDYASSDRRRFILALCHREADGPDVFRLGVIQERLASHAIEVDDETLIADLEFLRELELIELVGEFSDGHYVLAIPLMGTWIEKQQDFAAVMSKARSETGDQHG